MKFGKTRLIEVIGLGAVVLSLVFLAFEIRKSNRITAASVEAGLRYPAKIVFRFAIGSDSHYGSDIPSDPPDGNAQSVTNFVNWMNREKNDSRLDLVFINGDITMNPRTGWNGPGLNYPIDQGGYVESHYINIKANHLDRLEMPVFLNKGNHDYVDPDTDGAFHTWEGICKPFYQKQDYEPYTIRWGGPKYKTGNHVIEDKGNNYAWIMADATVYGESEQYASADVEWLAHELERLKNKRAVFILIHIAQRVYWRPKYGFNWWPRHGFNSEPVMNLIESFENVKAIFHGHNHDELGRYLSGGKPYFFDSHISSWGNKKGYRIVEIYSDGSMKTFQYDAEDNAIINIHALEALEDKEASIAI